MAQMKDIPASILASDGSEVKAGVLSILEKKGIKMLKTSDYQLNPLYWRLVSYAGQTYLLGYPKQFGGVKATKKLLIKGCSIEMNLPDKVVVSPHSNETFLCIQCGERIVFLKAETKRQRNKWVDAIRSAMEEPIYHPSTASTTSTDSSESFDVLRGTRDQLRVPSSVHQTADTAPRSGPDWRRVNTTPAGQFQVEHRDSISSIPSSAQALAHQNRRSPKLPSANDHQSELSAFHSLNSQDRMRSSSVGKRDYINLENRNDLDQYIYGLEEEYDFNIRPFSSSSNTSTSQPNLRLNVPDQGKLKRLSDGQSRSVPKGLQQACPSESGYEVPTPGGQDQEDEIYEDFMSDLNSYMSVQDSDDRSSVSHVDNLGLKSGGTHFYLEENHFDVPPKLPARNYDDPTRKINIKEGAPLRNKSSKKTRAPQPPAAPVDQMDSIEREKTVCLEKQKQSEHHDKLAGTVRPSGGDKVKEITEKMKSNDLKDESLHAYIQRFRGELFRKDGFVVEVDKTDLSPQTIKLVCVGDCICVAALPGTKLHSLLHVDDVIVKVNRQTLPSVDFCYTLFRTTDENKVQLHIKRVMHGIMCHVTMSANGDVDSLGLEFGNQSQGNEVTSMDFDGLVAKSGYPSRPQTHGAVNGGILVNWSLVEINQSPVSLDSSPKDVLDQIRRSGCELALVFIPVDITNVFRETSCEEVKDHSSGAEGKCS
ncbi:uncharacterized protein LOC129278365 [Lytechinus pictus]|uniref:uncharacterized protein LOC129278365 n=1 Tax=Lytechinus pictus TaxID=7653 RepID=UPI0030B9AFAC